MLDGNQPLIVFDNHDNPRWDRYGDGIHNTGHRTRAGHHSLHDQGNSPDVLRRRNRDEDDAPVRKEDVKDPIGVTGWPKEKGRDGDRTPMQWDDQHECRLLHGHAVAAGSGQLFAW